MLYFGMISYIDPYKNADHGHSQESMVFVNFAVEANDPDTALEKIRQRIIKLCDEDERYYNVHDFFLESLVEVGGLGSDAKEISWMSFLPFGESFARVLYHSADDPTLRNYGLRNSSSPFPNNFGQDSSVNLEVVPAEDDEEEDEVVPLISLDRDRRQIKPLYKDLCKRKFRGTLPDFKELSDGDLYELYVVEGCISSEIADLFEIEKSKVDYRRRKIGATFDESVMYSAARSLDVLDPIPYKGPQMLDETTEER